ncbi:unnamed protein product [Ranitomeya imitator]|uniref:Transposase n=1 Tax=Ranitomeya imitator TaxID=111125 RepID=A0ABN9M5D3_9NEOB|nr:unnamed protein product [Ranitomeya imitator]
MEDKFSNRGYPSRILAEARRNGVPTRTKDSGKRIPFVSTFHTFSNLIQTTIRRHWNLLNKSYPEIPEFKIPFFSCFRRAKNLRDRLVRVDMGSKTIVSKQTFLQTQKQGTFSCLNCLQCNNVQKGPKVFHPHKVQGIPIKGLLHMFQDLEQVDPNRRGQNRIKTLKKREAFWIFTLLPECMDNADFYMLVEGWDGFSRKRSDDWEARTVVLMWNNILQFAFIARIKEAGQPVIVIGHHFNNAWVPFEDTFILHEGKQLRIMKDVFGEVVETLKA